MCEARILQRAAGTLVAGEGFGENAHQIVSTQGVGTYLPNCRRHDSPSPIRFAQPVADLRALPIDVSFRKHPNAANSLTVHNDGATTASPVVIGDTTGDKSYRVLKPIGMRKNITQLVGNAMVIGIPGDTFRILAAPRAKLEVQDSFLSNEERIPDVFRYDFRVAHSRG